MGEVTVSNNGRMDFLSVSWRAAPGDVDSYLVTLSDHQKTLHTVSVSKSSPECVFNSLVSGRLYNISITSRSGTYLNHTFIQERTRMYITYCICWLQVGLCTAATEGQTDFEDNSEPNSSVALYEHVVFH